MNGTDTKADKSFKNEPEALAFGRTHDDVLITKKNDPEDGRRVLVSITEQGKEAFYEKQKEILLYGGAIVEHFGVDRIKDFIKSCREIRDVVDAVEKQQDCNKKHDN